MNQTISHSTIIVTGTDGLIDPHIVEALLQNNGPFRNNDQEEIQFQRKMDYLNTISDEDREKSRKHYASELMEFDPANTRFVTILNQLLPKSGS